VLHRNKCDNRWPLVEKIQIPAKAINVMNHTNQVRKREGEKRKRKKRLSQEKETIEHTEL
jgi:hypothetical protein